MYLVTYYAAGFTLTYEIRGFHAITYNDLPLCVLLSMIIACDAKLYTIISEHMPYFQGLHCHTLWLCMVTFASAISLSFWASILCFLMLYLLLFWHS